MKFKKFLFATMVAVAFTACNEATDPIVTPTPDPVPGDGKTYLSVAIDQVKTRAAADGTLNSLTVIVANENGVIELIQSADDLNHQDGNPAVITNGETGLFEVTAGAKQIMVIANATVPESLEEGDNLSEVATTYISFQNEGEENLSMNSGIYEIILPTGTRNYLGYSTTEVEAFDDPTSAEVRLHRTGEPVKLYRNVAKVVIRSIGMSQAWLDTTTYTKPGFVVENVTVVQAHGYSALASLTEWGATSFVPTAEMPWISPFDNGLIPGFGLEGSKWGKASPITGSFVNNNAPFFKVFPDDTNVGYAGGGEAEIYNPEEPIELYVYENTAVGRGLQTLVSISGAFSYEDKESGERYTEPVKRRYAFAVGETGMYPYKNSEDRGYVLPDGFDDLLEASGREFPENVTEGRAIGALRNLKYVVNLTINGKGTPGGDGEDDPDPDPDPDPDDDPWGPEDEAAELDVKVQVVDWGEVIQPVEMD